MLLEQLERARDARQRRLELRLADEMGMREQLQRVPQMLAGGFDRGMAVGTATTLERTAPVRSTAQVDDPAPLGCRTRHEVAPQGRRPAPWSGPAQYARASWPYRPPPLDRIPQRASAERAATVRAYPSHRPTGVRG